MSSNVSLFTEYKKLRYEAIFPVSEFFLLEIMLYSR